MNISAFNIIRLLFLRMFDFNAFFWEMAKMFVFKLETVQKWGLAGLYTWCNCLMHFRRSVDYDTADILTDSTSTQR